MTRTASAPRKQQPYHHGNLAQALVAAGLELAAEGGPEALSLREAARRAGVSPTATYRHFANRDALVMAVKVDVLARLGAALRRATRSRLPSGLGEAERARRRLVAIGRAYVDFAVGNPGEYRVIFADATFPDDDPMGMDPECDPYDILSEVLDQMEAAGALAPGRREGAEVPMWALVHGLSSLILEGPYRKLSRREQSALVQSALELVISGLQGGERPK
jgi:AcrR family transcriptional regulator